MTPNTTESWEQLLDRELVKAGLLDHSAQPSSTDASPPSSPPAFTPAAHDRSISVTQLRRDIVESLQAGMTLSLDIYDESDILLLKAGSLITNRFLRHLQERNITRVKLRSAQSDTPPPAPIEPRLDELFPEQALCTPRSRELDEQLSSELQKRIEYHAVKAWRRPHLALEDLKGQAVQGIEKHKATSEAVADLCSILTSGRAVSATDLRTSVTQFVGMATLDFDLLPMIVALQRSGDEYLYDHCVSVSLLSMAVASQLGLDRERTTVIGLGGMLHDVGMLRVPPSIRLAPRALNKREWSEIRRHPLHSLDMLHGLRGLPPAARFIAYQAHERIDGGGYPRERSGRQLHEFAKIVSMADVYVAMTHERPYRPAVLPYQAAKTILLDASTDRFDRDLVRAFLDTISLFPIGSRVGLSDGSRGQVLRANPNFPTRPVIEIIATDNCPTGHIIDLSRDVVRKVVKAE